MEEVFGGAQAYIWSATERTPGPTAYFGIIVGGIGGGIGGEIGASLEKFEAAFEIQIIYDFEL